MCGDRMDLIDGRPTGSVRVSFGYSSTLEDARLFLRFVYECFLLNNADVMASIVADNMSASVPGNMAASTANNVSESAAAGITESVPLSISNAVSESAAASMSGSVAASAFNSVSLSVPASITASMFGSVSASTSESICANITPSLCDGNYQPPADNVISVAYDDDDDDEMCKVSAPSDSSYVVSDALKLVRIFIYPVKSCAAVEVK